MVPYYVVTAEKVSFNADSRRLHADGRRLYCRDNLRISAFDLRKSAFENGFFSVNYVVINWNIKITSMIFIRGVDFPSSF